MNRAFQPILPLLLLSISLASGCAGGRLSHDQIRRQIADIGTSTLVPNAVAVRRVVSQSENRVIAETSVELAFQFERDTPTSPWFISAVRLGDQNWVDLDELVAALNENRRRTTAESLQKLLAGVENFRARTGAAPAASSIQGLTDSLHPQYMSDLVLDDAWGRPIQIESTAPLWRFRSFGPDGQRGTQDDVVVPER